MNYKEKVNNANSLLAKLTDMADGLKQSNPWGGGYGNRCIRIGI